MKGVSILLLNLEEETNPGSKRAMVLTETSHGDGVFKVYSPLSNSTVFIKTLNLGLRPIAGNPLMAAASQALKSVPRPSLTHHLSLLPPLFYPFCPFGSNSESQYCANAERKGMR